MADVTSLAQGAGNVVAVGKTKPVTLKHEIDLSELNALGFLTTEEVYIWNVPAETDVKMESVENATVLTNVTRIDVGDAGSATQWVNNASTLTAGTNHTIATEREYYASADRVGCTLAGTVASMTGTLRFVATFTDGTRIAPATDRTYTNS